MVRLKVVDYEIIRLAACKGLLEVLFPLVCHTGVRGVKDGCLAVQDHVGVV